MDFDEERNEETDQPNEDVEMADKVGDREADELKPSINGSPVRKLFVGRISKKTTEESFREYFSKFGQVAGSELLRDKDSGRRRGIGFVSYANPEIADKVLKEDHTIDGKKVYVKKALDKTTRIYVGGFPLSLTQDELKEYFSSYGYVVDHCIVLDKTTGQSKGFGFVSFDKEETVEEVLSNGHMHELRGKQVKIRKSKPKRDCVEHTSESQIHHGGSGSKSYYSDGGSVEAFGGGYGGNMGSGYGGYGGYEGYGDYGGYGKFAGGYGASPTGFYPGYGYGFWFDGAMYGAAHYEGSTYGIPAYYGGGSGYGNRGNDSYDGCNGGYGGGGGNGAYAYGNACAANGRYLPAYYGGGSGYGNRGNGSYDGGNGGYGGGGRNGAYAYGNACAANGRYLPVYYGGGSGYGNSGNGSNDGGNRGYGGGGGNGAYAYGNASADNGRSVPAYYGGVSDDGSRGNNSDDGGNGGYGGVGENGAAGADNGSDKITSKAANI